MPHSFNVATFGCAGSCVVSISESTRVQCLGTVPQDRPVPTELCGVVSVRKIKVYLLIVLGSVSDPDPHGSAVLLVGWIRIRRIFQCKEIDQNKQIKQISSRPKMLLYLCRNVL